MGNRVAHVALTFHMSTVRGVFSSGRIEVTTTLFSSFRHEASVLGAG